MCSNVFHIVEHLVIKVFLEADGGVAPPSPSKNSVCCVETWKGSEEEGLDS